MKRAEPAVGRRPRRPTRIGPRTHIRREDGAWAVKIMRRGQDYSGHFADSVWGGRNRALLAAQRFRDETLQRIGPDSRERRRVPKGRRSSTGIVGVSVERHRVEGRVYHRAVAVWHDAEKGPQRRRFLFERYGKDEAVALAAKARKVGVARSRAYLMARQREEAAQRLHAAPPLPARVKDPLSRKGISMARRRPRRGT
jgi:hypothetical protein